MANQNSKKKVQVWMDPALVAQLDGIAAREGKTRAAVMSEAVEAYVSGDSRGDAASAKLETIIAKLDSIKSEQQAQATLLAAKIDAQPIAVQLPAAEPAATEPEPKKGIFARLFDR